MALANLQVILGYGDHKILAFNSEWIDFDDDCETGDVRWFSSVEQAQRWLDCHPQFSDCRIAPLDEIFS